LDTGEVNLETAATLIENKNDISSSSNNNTKNETEKRFFYEGATVSKWFGPDWRVLIIGAGQLPRYTAEFLLALDYDVLVCDPRPGFTEAWQVADVPVLNMSPDDAVLAYATDANSAVLALKSVWILAVIPQLKSRFQSWRTLSK